MGSSNWLNYTVLGVEVNLASRLYAIAPAGEIYLSEATVGEVNSTLSVEPVGLHIFQELPHISREPGNPRLIPLG